MVYDRATSIHPGLFKRFNLSLVTNPAINGKTATEVLSSGQQLFMQTLLPQNAAISARYAAGDLNPIAQLEPTQYIMTVQDPTNPIDTRFLHVLQGADSGVAMVPADVRPEHYGDGIRRRSVRQHGGLLPGELRGFGSGDESAGSGRRAYGGGDGIAGEQLLQCRGERELDQHRSGCGFHGGWGWGAAGDVLRRLLLQSERREESRRGTQECVRHGS